MTQTKKEPISPYSHGLEKNYVVETIDLKTVKPFAHKGVNAHTKILHSPQQKFRNSAQLRFHFGARFDGAMRSIKLYESVDSLALSLITKQAIKNAQLETVYDLVIKKSELSKWVTKGQVDEIEEKLIQYLGPDPLELIEEYDLRSLLRVFLADLPPLLRLLMSKRYRLQHLFSYASSDLIEIERLTPKTREELINKSKMFIMQKKEKLYFILKNIAESCFYPFFSERLGIAERWELEEYFYNHCLGGYNQENQAIVSLLQELLHISFLFDDYLRLVTSNVYAVSEEIAQDFQSVTNLAKSYFYSPQTTYPLNRLTTNLELDFIKKWVTFKSGFIEKTLILCDHFIIKREQQILIAISSNAFDIDNHS